MSPKTRAALEIYGTNKRVWQKRVFGLIPKEQLPVQIGGYMVYNLDN